MSEVKAPSTGVTTHTSTDHLGIDRIIGFSDNTWEPAAVEPSQEELDHAEHLYATGVLPRPEKAAKTVKKDA